MQATNGASTPLDFADVLDQLLHSVSHDLRSPLLTMSLGTELIAAAVGDDERAALALDSLRHGAKDLERMLDAVSLLSRARRRVLTDESVPLPSLLGDHSITPGVDGLDQLTVRVDRRPVTEIIETASAGSTITVGVSLQGPDVRLTLPVPQGTPEVVGSPLAQLMGALRLYAGTVIAKVAAAEAQLARQGGAVAIVEHELQVRLPRAGR